MIIWAAGVVLAVIAAALGPGASAAAARATAGPFVTLAAIILASALAGRAGAFQALAGVLIPVRGPRVAAAAVVLALTAVLSALVNLDVAVVVAMPVALRAAARRGLPADRLALAVAVVANAASFLLPTSNVTNLLLLGRVPLSTLAYLQDSWLPWILVTAITAGPLAMWAAHADPAPARAVTAAREDPSARSKAPAREDPSARSKVPPLPPAKALPPAPCSGWSRCSSSRPRSARCSARAGPCTAGSPASSPAEPCWPARRGTCPPPRPWCQPDQ